MKLADLQSEELFGPGHRLCAGCGASIVARMTLKAVEGDAIVVNATGCLEVATTVYPHTAWGVPWVHGLFENAPAIADGIERTLRARRRAGADIPEATIVVFAGDGGTFDIGLQALSGALERQARFLFICYDNEGYMNTGVQRSSATPEGAATTTTPVGKVSPGKVGRKKDLVSICVDHGVEYAATASPAYWNDFMGKVRKASKIEGAAAIHVLAPCPLGWRFDPRDTIAVARLAVQTRYFPLYEVIRGRYSLSVNPLAKPLEEFLRAQGRFQHLFRPEFRYELDTLRSQVEENWIRLTRLVSMSRNEVSR